MKSRLFYFLISGIIILSVLSGIIIWRSKHLNPIPEYTNKSYNAPVSSKYIPANSNLVLHWKVNPATFPNYIENYQHKGSKANINRNTISIRDSLFKLISLDFKEDMSKWAGDYGSFAILNSNNSSINDWILVLGIKDDIKVEKELESFLESKISYENTNIINKIRTSKTEIIPENINSIFYAKDKENILISSDPKNITASFEQSNSNLLNTKENYKNIQLKDNLNDGLLLLELNPKKIINLLDQKENLFEINEIRNLISSINIDENQLILDGILSYDVRTKMPNENINYNLIDIEHDSKSPEDSILIDSPINYFGKDSSHPYQKFIAFLIKKSSSNDYNNLLKVILENSKGNLIWLNDKDWLVLARKSDATKRKIMDILKKDNFMLSNIDFQKRKLEVWSKISTVENQKYEIKENIEAIFIEGDENYIWSKNLAAIKNLENIDYLRKLSDSEKSNYETNDFNDVLRIHLGQEKTKIILNNFYPFMLLKTLLGNKLSFPNNIDISISVPEINYSDFIKFKINVKTS